MTEPASGGGGGGGLKPFTSTLAKENAKPFCFTKCMKINVYVQFCLGESGPELMESGPGRLAGSSCSPARPGGGARESSLRGGGANMEAAVPVPPAVSLSSTFQIF